MPSLNDDALDVEGMQKAQEYAREKINSVRELTKAKFIEEENLMRMLIQLHIKHAGDVKKIEADTNKAIQNINKSSGIRMSYEERERISNIARDQIRQAEITAKQNAEIEIQRMRRELKSEEEINARKRQLDLELTELKKKNINTIIDEYGKLNNQDKLSRDAKRNQLKTIGNSYDPSKYKEHESVSNAKGILGKGKAILSNVKADFSNLGSAVKSGDTDYLGAAATKFLKAGELFKKQTEQANENAKKSEDRLKDLDAEWNKRIEEGEDPDSPEMLQLKETREQAKNQAIKDKNLASALNGVSKAIDSMKGDYKKAFGEASTILNDYQGSIDARLQGSDKTFKDLSDTISSNLSISPYVKTTKVLEKLKEATEKGINYNLEQRTFLASLTDKIATTFDAFDSNLMRIIRLQQADSTASRLGMEASLTKLFNNMFEDSSYLSETADQVAGALVDAQSQMSNQGAAEFEYIVQKWLGALGSLGMGSDTLTQIATGLNYLATGDVTNLASNNALQTMFAMAASNANLEYSELLLDGLDATKTNQLLEGMITYLKEIADNSENQVVKAAYGDIFNMSHSDMRALSNLTAAEISTLAGTTMSYGQMQTELNNQFNQLSARTSLATMLTNVYDNVMYGMASDMVNNPVTFAMTKMLDWMKETGTDINIPFINAMGFGLDLNASVGDLMQMGLGITQAFSMTSNILSGLSSGGGLNLDKWDASETTKRGAGLNLSSLSTLGGTSGSIGTFAVSGSSSDTKTSTMSSATDDSEESKKITNKNSKPPEKTIEDLYKAIVGDSAESYALVRDPILSYVHDSTRNSLRVHIEGLALFEGTIPVYDAALKAELTSQMDAIKALMSIHQTVGVQKVKLVDGTIIQVQQDTIAAAIKEVLFDNEDKTFNGLIDTVANGSLKIDSVSQPVQVKNATGDKLQVSNLIW